MGIYSVLAFFVFASSNKSCSSSLSPLLKSFAKNGKTVCAVQTGTRTTIWATSTQTTQPSSLPDLVPRRRLSVTGPPTWCGFGMAVECRFHRIGQATQQICTLPWSILTTQLTTMSHRWSLRNSVVLSVPGPLAEHHDSGWGKAETIRDLVSQDWIFMHEIVSLA